MKLDVALESTGRATRQELSEDGDICIDFKPEVGLDFSQEANLAAAGYCGPRTAPVEALDTESAVHESKSGDVRLCVAQLVRGHLAALQPEATANGGGSAVS